MRAVLVAACAAAVFCVGSGAAGAPPALLQAITKSNSAKSETVTLDERVAQGSQVTTIRLQGVEQPQAKTGSFVLDISPAQPGVGQASEILVGSKLYIHYPVLDTLHAKNPKVKSWIVVDTTSSLGVNPSSLTALEGEQLQDLTGIKIVGTGTVDGIAVTRYAGTLDLRKAAHSGPMQQLLSHLPSSAAAVLNGTAQIELWVGSDGYLHRTITTFSLPVTGQKAFKITVDGTLSGFDKSNAPIVAPAAGDTMTLAQFGQLTGSAPAPSAADTALLQKVVLKPAQVGAGYKLSQMPGGHEVQNEVTLDFCDATYPSESLRTARLQVLYDATGNAFHASNEVVTYQPGGAKQALAEVTHEAAVCPNGNDQESARRRHEPGAAYARRRRLPAPAGRDRDPRDRQRSGQGQADDLDHDGRLPDPREPPERRLRLRHLAGLGRDEHAARGRAERREPDEIRLTARGGQREGGQG